MTKTERRASSGLDDWISHPPAVLFSTKMPDMGKIIGHARDATSVRSGGHWRLGGHLGSVLDSLLRKGGRPSLHMMLLPTDAQAGPLRAPQIIVAMYLTINGRVKKSVMAKQSTIQTVVDAVVTGRPDNLPADSEMTIAVPSGDVESPIRWAGGRRGVLVVTGQPDNPFRLVWGDRTDEARRT